MNYESIYNKLINRAVGRLHDLEGHEKHFILPKCMGGRNVKENVVYLTYKEHYLAHQLLIKMFPDSINLLYETYMMTKKSRSKNRDNKEYSWIRKRRSAMVSKFLSGKKRGPYNKSKPKDAYFVALELEMFKEILNNFKKPYPQLVYLSDKDVQEILNLLNEYNK